MGPCLGEILIVVPPRVPVRMSVCDMLSPGCHVTMAREHSQQLLLAIEGLYKLNYSTERRVPEVSLRAGELLEVYVW